MSDAMQTIDRDSVEGMAISNDPIVIPHNALSGSALRGVIESFVLREGTDYGEREVCLEWKVDLPAFSGPNFP